MVVSQGVYPHEMSNDGASIIRPMSTSAPAFQPLDARRIIAFQRLAVHMYP
jgi:hypothetical protein